MTADMSDDALIRGDISAEQLCRHLGSRVAECGPPPPGARAIYSWRHFEWFWCGISAPLDQAPGEWAKPMKYDISQDVTHDEGLVWGRGILEFFPTVASLGRGYHEVKIPGRYETVKRITTDIHWNFKHLISPLEQLCSEKLNFLYADEEELHEESLSVNMRKQRRGWLLEVIQAHLSWVIECRVSLPLSPDTPNRTFMEAFLAGWIPVGYVGPLKTGSAVVFHPAIKGPP